MRRATSRVLFLLIAAALLAPAAIPAAAAPGPIPSLDQTSAITVSQYAVEREECAFLKLINDYRVSKGKRALKLDRRLGAAADHHSRDMVAHNYTSHTLYNGTSWSQNITNHGYPTDTSRAENIAWANKTALATFNQWKNSPPHNANMLSSTYRAIGIGRYYGANTTFGYYWTTTFGSTSATSQTITCP